jgi:hypothetical protein
MRGVGGPGGPPFRSAQEHAIAMPKFYRINSVGPGFDGLIVEGRESPMPGESDFVLVDRVFDDNRVAGDRVVSSPTKGLAVLRIALTPCDDPRLRQFDSTNPWGKCLYENEYRKDGVHVACAMYERCLQATVTHAGKTIFSDYFFDDAAGQALESIEETISDGDLDDLVFALRVLKGVSPVG